MPPRVTKLEQLAEQIQESLKPDEHIRAELSLDKPPPSYEELGRDVGKLVEEKQKAYGDSFGRSGEVLKILYPNGVRPEQLDDMLFIARVVDKLFRIATDKDALGEDPFRDIAGYGLLGMAKK